MERLHTGISVTLSFKFSLHHLGVKKQNKTRVWGSEEKFLSIFFVQGGLGAILVSQCIEAAVGLLSDCTFGEKIHGAYM